MIEYLRRAYGIDRVAIVDTDCHHGDGTQDIYWHDPDTLFISIHQDGRTLYPGSGFLNEIGGPNAVGTTINIPLPPHTLRMKAFCMPSKKVVLPILEDFKPDLIINSAGQDNHYSDPITNMNFSARGLCRTDPPAQGRHRRSGRRVFHRRRPALCQYRHHPGHGRPGLQPFARAGLRSQTLPSERRYHAQHQTTCAKVLQTWRQREAVAEALRARPGCDKRSRKIFYDTDQYYEVQAETVRICDDCGGALRIESSSDRSISILAVHLPRKACPVCRKQAYDWYAEGDAKQFDHIFLQDNTEDLYLTKKKKGSPEQ
jgi:hypothetical protein